MSARRLHLSTDAFRHLFTEMRTVTGVPRAAALEASAAILHPRPVRQLPKRIGLRICDGSNTDPRRY